MGANISALKKTKNKVITNSNHKSSEAMISYDRNCKCLVRPEEITEILPVYDEDETARINTTHFLHKIVWDQTNFSAPITKQLEGRDFNVLDVGCGSGVWTLDMATTYPNANFLAVDVIQTFPNEIRPKNVNFLLGNIITGLNVEPNTFDYVFMRYMKGSIPTNDWSKAIGEIIRVTKPNGWFELIECDDMFIDGTPEFIELVDKVEKKLKDNYGLSYCPIKVIKDILLNKNFDVLADVQILKKKMPITGHWDNDFDNKIAKIVYDHAIWGSRNHKNSLDYLDLTPDGYDDYIKKVFESGENHRTSYTIYRIIARKI